MKAESWKLPCSQPFVPARVFRSFLAHSLATPQANVRLTVRNSLCNGAGVGLRSINKERLGKGGKENL